MSSCNRTVINKKRVIEALNALIACLPAGANISGLSGLINSCCTLEDALAIYALAVERGICFVHNAPAAENCEWPSSCPFFTVTTLDPTPGLNIYDGRARGFLFQNLVTTNGGISFSPFTDPVVTYFPMSFLETIDFPLLHDIGGDLDCIGHPVLRSFLAPAFVSALGSVLIGSNPSLQTIDLTSLATVGADLGFSGNDNIDHNFPALVSVGGAFGISTSTITSVELPLLAFVGGSFGLSDGPISSYRLPSLTTFHGTNFTSRNCALDQATVDHLLVRLDTIKGTFSGPVAIDLSGGTSSAPSATGAAAAASLIGAGNTVTTN
jgi:hypothetical protein